MHVNRDGSIDGVCMILHLRDMEADVELHCEWPPGHINARSNANTARGRRWGWTGTGGSSLARPKASELFIRGVGAEDDKLRPARRRPASSVLLLELGRNPPVELSCWQDDLLTG